ncbi:MAG: dipicolinate synthase [Roseburia sp.]|nr:dipicolinate synthase [Roseburia sp.]
MNKFDIAIIGGDNRTACMAPIFAEKKLRVICYGTVPLKQREAVCPANIYHAASLQEALENTPAIVCGIPFERNGCLYWEQEQPAIPLTELQRCLRKHQKIFGGVIPEGFRRLCDEREIGCYDFMKEEPLTLFNAVATAEGAILEALSHKATLLHHSPVLVLGYGRCGKPLAQKLLGLSAFVTVCSSCPVELSMADALGCRTLPLSKLGRKIKDYEYLFNTIPACILNEYLLKNVRKDALIIDIASNRCGMDYEAAQKLNLAVRYCPGLPGKYAGVSCASRLAEYVMNACP